jgi:hypothetical protein
VRIRAAEPPNAVTDELSVNRERFGQRTCTRWRQAPKMDLSNATAWFVTTALRLPRLWCPFGEVQQDFFLSYLTIG